jgi:hypothetical protein
VNTTWAIYKPNFGAMALLGLALFGIAIGQQVAGFVVNQVGAATGDLAVVIFIQLIWNLINLVIQVAVTLAGFKYCLALIHTGRTDFGEFGAIGEAFLPCLIKDFLVGLGVLAAAVVCFGPGFLTLPMREEGLTVIVFVGGGAVFLVGMIIAMLGVFIAGPLIADRGVGSIESLKMSWEFTTGNRGTLFGALFVVGLLGTLFSCCTLYVGFIFFLPYISLFTCVSYIMITGQRHTIAPGAFGPTMG